MRRLITSVISIIIIISISVNAFASSNEEFYFEQRTVSVGISQFPHFSEINDDNGYSGIIIDYLREIQKYTGWKVEYVVIEDPSNAIKMLDAGTIDLMGAMIKNNQTMELYDFAELSSGYAYSTITVNKSHTEYIPNDYDSFKGMKVGIYKKAISKIQAFEKFRLANGIEVVPVYFDDSDKWEEAYKTGAVDAQLTSSAKLREDEKIIASFQMEPYYFGVSKGNTEVLRELNYALEQIARINPQFDTELYKKHFAEGNYEEFNLTTEEKKFVEEHPVLQVAAVPDWEPISYFDKKNGYKGISADIMKIISEKTGFKLEYIPTQSLEHSLKLLETNEADILVGVANGEVVDSGYDLAFSIPYLPIQTVMLHKNRVNIKAVENPIMAAVQGFEYNVMDKCAVKKYDKPHDAIEAIKRGEADFTVISNLAAEEYMVDHGKSGLNIIPLSNIDAKLSIALNNPANPTLLTILDRTIYSIDDAELQAVIFQNTSMKDDITFRNLIYANPTQSIFFIMSIGLIVLFLLFIVMHMRLRLSRKTLIISDTYRIIGELCDEYILDYDFETSKLSLPGKFAKLIGVDTIIDGKNCHDEKICGLLYAFRDNKDQQSFSVERNCKLANGGEEMFRATCVIIRDIIDRPIRGLGKIVSIQNEVNEKMYLEERVNVDSLTGIYSKDYCEQFAKTSIKENHEIKMAMMLIDVDNFKNANDTIGHLGGDEVLKHVAAILDKVFHNGEIIGRWGGDEFIVIIHDDCDKPQVEEIAKKLCAEMNHTFNYNGSAFQISISVGIAFLGEHKEFRDLFQAADDALYSIKRNQKNGYGFAASENDV